MFRALVGWIFGFVSGFLIFAGIVTNDLSIRYVSYVITILTFIGCMYIAHKHHIRKRKDYYDRLRNNTHKFL